MKLTSVVVYLRVNYGQGRCRIIIVLIFALSWHAIISFCWFAYSSCSFHNPVTLCNIAAMTECDGIRLLLCYRANKNLFFRKKISDEQKNNAKFCISYNEINSTLTACHYPIVVYHNYYVPPKHPINTLLQSKIRNLSTDIVFEFLFIVMKYNGINKIIYYVILYFY